MKRPQVVRIAAREWPIYWDDVTVDAGSNFGETSSVTHSLRIAQMTPAQRQPECLLHEILHAIDQTYLVPKDATPERNIKLLAASLFTVLRENPEVTAYILGKEG